MLFKGIDQTNNLRGVFAFNFDCCGGYPHNLRFRSWHLCSFESVTNGRKSSRRTRDLPHFIFGRNIVRSSLQNDLHQTIFFDACALDDQHSCMMQVVRNRTKNAEISAVLVKDHSDVRSSAIDIGCQTFSDDGNPSCAISLISNRLKILAINFPRTFLHSFFDCLARHVDALGFIDSHTQRRIESNISPAKSRSNNDRTRCFGPHLPALLVHRSFAVFHIFPCAMTSHELCTYFLRLFFAPIDKNKFNEIEPWLSPLALLLPSALYWSLHAALPRASDAFWHVQPMLPLRRVASSLLRV